MLIENWREADEKKLYKNQDLQQEIIPNSPQIKLLNCGMYFLKDELNYINFKYVTLPCVSAVYINGVELIELKIA